jgi:hypothetical protein
MATIHRSPKSRHALSSVLALALLGFTSDTAAQQPAARDMDWQHGTTLTVFGGGATASSESAPAAGLSIGWEASHHLTIEGRGVWFDTSRGSSAFTALLGARAPLMPARRFNPYVSGSVGMFRATFTSGAENVPDFYLKQMEPGGTRAGTFDDFVVALGGGADFFLNDHFALRPELSVLLVTSGSDTASTVMYGVTLAYHFEGHPLNRRR